MFRYLVGLLNFLFVGEVFEFFKKLMVLVVSIISCDPISLGGENCCLLLVKLGVIRFLLDLFFNSSSISLV